MKAPTHCVSASALVLLLVPYATAEAQSNTAHGDDCTLSVYGGFEQEVLGNCNSSLSPSATNVVPSGLQVSRNFECANDCQLANSGSLGIYIESDCRYQANSGAGWQECPYSFGSEGYQGDLRYSIIGHDGKWISSQVCSNGGRKHASVSCFHCGHPCEEPVLISLRDADYRLTGMAGGVSFDLSGDGQLQSIPWTAPDSDDAFLVLDRNGNGTIDSGTELFSHVTPQPDPPEGEVPHGFRALAVYDSALNGGNGDGEISAQDAIFPFLRLWLDTDHDGSTDAGELLGLDEAGLARISLDYTDTHEHRDEFGNVFKFSTTAVFADARSVQAWVVYFNLESCLACDDDSQHDEETVE